MRLRKLNRQLNAHALHSVHSLIEMRRLKEAESHISICTGRRGHQTIERYYPYLFRGSELGDLAALSR